jgi:hypothetical protein
VGVAELRYERLNYNISESPLNPPILRDFEVRRPPRIGGWGANSYLNSATPESENWSSIAQRGDGILPLPLPFITLLDVE